MAKESQAAQGVWRMHCHVLLPVWQPASCGRYSALADLMYMTSLQLQRLTCRPDILIGPEDLFLGDHLLTRRHRKGHHVHRKSTE